MDKDKMRRLLSVLLAIVVLGSIEMAYRKFNIDLPYAPNQRIEIYMNNTDYEINDIKTIAQNVYNTQKVIVQQIGSFKEIVGITVKSSTDEQIDTLLKKINENYETEFTQDTILRVYNSNIKIRDVLTPYITPSIISAILILVYIGVKYRRLGVIRIVATTIGTVFMSIFLFALVISVTHTLVNRLVIAMGISIAILITVYLCHTFEMWETQKTQKTTK